MRLLHAHNPTASRHASRRGFTIVEMLVVAPIALLVVTGLVSAMVAMIGDALVANTYSTVTYDTQDTLNRVEQDARISISFAGTLSFLSAPQGKDDNTSAFQSSSGDLILTQQATTSSPYEVTRSLVYYKNQPNACGSTTETSNRVLLNRVVYFLKGTTLWRRTIVNPANTNVTADGNTICETPWQRNSCSPGQTVTPAVGSTCQTYDERMLDDVSTFAVTYYTAAGSTTTDPTQAETISVRIAVQKGVASKVVDQDSTLRVTRTNDIAPPQAPTAPAISILAPFDNTLNNPLKVTVQWSAPFATYYTVETQVNGGGWSAPTSTASSSVSIDTPYAKSSVSVRVTAYNDYGQTAQTTYTTESLLWASCSLLNNWTNYAGYAPAEFTITSAKVVEVRGLIRDGSAGVSVCNLPAGFRPSSTLIFPVLTDGANYGVNMRADVTSSGDIKVSSSAAGWVSLEGIHFIPSGSGYTWTNFSLQNLWKNSANPAMANLAYTTDSVGRTHIQGVTDAGTTSDNTIIGQTLPSGLRPSEYYQLPAAGSGTANAVALNGPNGTIVAKGDSTSYAGLAHMFYPSSMSGWKPLVLSNNWQAYSASTYTQPEYRKGSDNLVTVKGLIKRSTGTPTLWEVIGTLDAGYRPKEDISMLVDIYSATAPQHSTGRVNISSAGTILYINGNTNWTSLDNITFYADGS